jgi:hypothetical protein
MCVCVCVTHEGHIKLQGMPDCRLAALLLTVGEPVSQVISQPAVSSSAQSSG